MGPAHLAYLLGWLPSWPNTGWGEALGARHRGRLQRRAVREHCSQAPICVFPEGLTPPERRVGKMGGTIGRAHLGLLARPVLINPQTDRTFPTLDGTNQPGLGRNVSCQRPWDCPSLPPREALLAAQASAVLFPSLRTEASEPRSSPRHFTHWGTDRRPWGPREARKTSPCGQPALKCHPPT